MKPDLLGLLKYAGEQVDMLADARARIWNLEKIAQALADELMAQDDILDNVIIEYAHALDELENEQILRSNAEVIANTLADEPESTDWQQTQEDARNAGNP